MNGKRWSENYVAHVLQPNFAQAKRYLFKPLLLTNRAHALMLYKTQLMPGPHAAQILAALETIEHQGVDAYKYNEKFEDLYFAVESNLIELTGAETGGNLQIGRSRNDIDAAMIRMVLRESVLGLLEGLAELRQAILDCAIAGLHAYMPGYTHHQPAQPTTLAHYLGAILGCLERDARRLHMAYSTINRNPLGAAAMTGTGFAINRSISEELLGFEGLVENTIDAVGGADHTLEAMGAVMTCATNLSRFNFDLLSWATREVGFLRVADSFVQISSIMPQKRNPVVLEHVRAKLTRGIGDAREVYDLARNVPFGDVNDVAEPALEPMLGAITSLDEAVALLTAVLQQSSFNTEVMQARAGEHFTTATGLADWLVQTQHFPFRTAHQVASSVVDAAYASNTKPQDIGAALLSQAAQRVTGAPLLVTDQDVQRALDVETFVIARTLPGGPAPHTMRPYLQRAQDALRTDESWRRAELTRLQHARNTLESESQRCMALHQDVRHAPNIVSQP